MVRHSLYQRSARTWPRVYSLPNRYSSGSPSTVRRSGVDPADEARPTGLISSTVSPSWSRTACRIAAPRRPVTSTCAVRPRRYTTGNTSLGVKNRNAVTEMATPSATPNSTSSGWSTARYSRDRENAATTAATAAFAYDRGRPGTTRQYTAPIRKKASPATTVAGAEYPPQLPMIHTPYGLGRDRPV